MQYSSVLDDVIMMSLYSSIFDDVGEYVFDPKAAPTNNPNIDQLNYFDKPTIQDEVHTTAHFVYSMLPWKLVFEKPWYSGSCVFGFS